jgi:hypothetical protein
MFAESQGLTETDIELFSPPTVLFIVVFMLYQSIRHLSSTHIALPIRLLEGGWLDS